MHPALAAAALAASLASAPPDLPPVEAVPEPGPYTASVAAGAGWDSNLARQPGGGQGPTAGVLAWRAAAGRFFAPGEAGALLVEASWSGEQSPDGSAPSEQRPGAALTFAHPLGERLTLRAGLSAEWLGSEDPLRRGPGGGASLSLALRLAPALTLRAGLSGYRTEAEDAAWSIHRTRLRAAASLAPWRGAELVLGYAWQAGVETAYVPAAAAPVSASGYGAGYGGGTGTGAGSGTGSSWATSAYQAVRSPATAHVLSVDAEQALPGGLFVAGGWSWTRGTTTAAGGWTGSTLQVELGWRY